jgi:hypothetical protein
MLTTGQIDHFSTFGFTILRGYLADRVTALRAEVDTALRDAYAATYDERVFDGISGHYLPMASRLTPGSASLVCDDPRLIGAAEQLLGGPVIPECPEGVLYFSEAGWHTDDGMGVRGVKFAAYFDELTADTGALRLVPGSHHPEQNARLAGYSCRRGPARSEAEAAAYQTSFPGYIADTSPGDVIAFDLHTLAREYRRPGPAGLDGGLPALPRDRAQTRTDAAFGARQLRAGIPRLRPGPLPRLAGLDRRCRRASLPGRRDRADAARRNPGPAGRAGRLVTRGHAPAWTRPAGFSDEGW